MIIMGIDPGFAIVGVGIIEYKGNKFRVLDYFAVTTKAGLAMELRLKSIYDEIDEAIKKYKPDCMAIEELFFNNNAKTALQVGQARGIILLAAVNNALPISEYTPLQVKQSVVGYGRAAKGQIQQMTKAMLALNEIPKPDDVADALAIAICHAHSHKMVKIGV
ncbi:MAG: crossover junction endodeoxyribonuclease RuvC, partial [Clostridia bacterium]|nr:crossover junction endodeoxyribonuclease RuvC [Clostridia bacterium]